MGLTIARAIVEKHGGTLSVDSAVGRGSLVRMTLPSATSVAASRPTLPAVQSGGGRLLLMDDEPAVRGTAGALLRQLGYTVELAAHGEEAVALYQAAHDRDEPFDLVILDLTVRGGMGGLAALQALRRLSANIMAIASSGHADDPVLVDPTAHGFQGALPKPFRLVELSEVVSKLLRP